MEISTPSPAIGHENKSPQGKIAYENSENLESPKSPSSPSSRCPICLSSQDNPAKGDECEHIFCFQCLKEWSKVKAECPLCKKSMRKIKYGFQGEQEYLIPDPIRSATGTLRASAAWSYHNAQLHAINQRRLGHSNLTAIRESRNNLIIRKRRHYYWKGIRVSYVTSGNRVRDVSPEFFRSNQVQTFRLIPWIRRELTVLFGSHNKQIISRCQQLIISLIQWYHIDSEAFFEEIRPYCLQHTEHFVHEFLSFARSPYDISEYDKHAVYLQNDMPLTHLPSGRPTTSIPPSFLTNQWNLSPETGTSIPEVSAQSMMLARSRWEDDDLTTVNARPLHSGNSPTLSHRPYAMLEEHQTSSSNMFLFPTMAPQPLFRQEHISLEPSELFPPLNSQSIDQLSSTSRHSRKQKRISQRHKFHKSTKRRLLEQKKKEVIVITSSSDEETATSIQHPTTFSQNNSRGSSGSEIEFISYVKPPHLRTPDAYIDLDSDDNKPGPSKPRTKSTIQKPIIVRSNSISSDSPSPARQRRISLKRINPVFDDSGEESTDKRFNHVDATTVKIKPRKTANKVATTSTYASLVSTTENNNIFQEKSRKHERSKSMDTVIEKIKSRKLSLS